jgi:anti-sigma factor RsiW
VGSAFALDARRLRVENKHFSNAQGAALHCSDIAELAALHFSGELDPPHATAFAAHLDACPSCARQIRQQADVDARLREAIAGEEIDATALGRSVRERIAAGASPAALRPTRARWILAAAAALLLVITAAGYRSVIAARAARVYTDAAEDHQDEVVARQSRTWLLGPTEIAALARNHGVPAETVAKVAPQGYELNRARLCMLDGRVYLHLVYTGHAGEFSVFLRQRSTEVLRGSERETANGKRIFTTERGPAHIAGLQSGNLTAFVVTDQPGDSALRLAESVAGAL